MTAGAIVIAILAVLTAGVAAMAFHYAIYRAKVSKGREWHPERKVRKPFWL